MPKQLDFFFFYGSTYTYLTVMRIEEVAARAGIEVRWRPFDVRAIMIEQNNIPFRGKKPSEKAHERTSRLTIKRVIATYMNVSPVWGTLS